MADIRSRAEVELIVNGSKAQEQIEQMKKRSEELRKKMDECVLKGDTKGAQRLQRQLERLDRQTQKLRDSQIDVIRTLSNLDKASLKDLQKTLRSLEKEFRELERGSEAWTRKLDDIRRVRAEIGKVTSAMRTQQKETEGAMAVFQRWQVAFIAGFASILGWINRVVMKSDEAVRLFASMDQEMANVRKFTGMDEGDVAELNEQFKKIDTRTSREELNKLAQEAGRLGKTSQEDVLGFVRAADKINVALDDLGEGATLTLSKLTGIFGDEKRLGTEKALLSVGSVINELSQNCSASAPYLAEFASRMGGVGAQAGMTVQQIMAFGAVLDSSNQAVEASSTALQQVIVRLLQDPAKYARVAGLDVKRFSALVRTDMNAAVIELLETLQKAGGMDVLSPMFKDMGENGSRTISTLAALAGHIDEVKSQQLVANKAFEEAVSIDKEFDVQNNTVQAGLDKAKKRVAELAIELGQKLQPVMRLCISSSTIALKALSATVTFISANIKEIGFLVIALTSYTVASRGAAAATVAMTAASKAWAVITKAIPATVALCRVAIAALYNSVLYFTRGLQVNYDMQLRWRSAISALTAVGPAKFFIVATAAAVALGKAVMNLVGSYNSLSAVAKMMNDIRSKAAEKVAEEKVQIKYLMEAANDLNKTEKERLKICGKLNEIVPNMTATIDAMTGSFIYSTKAVEDHIRALTHLYEIEGAKEQLKELGKERAELTVKRNQLDDDMNKIQEQRAGVMQSYSGFSATTSQSGSLPTMPMTLMSFSGDTSAIELDMRRTDRKLKENEDKLNAIYKTYGVMELMSSDSGSDPEEPEAPGGTYTKTLSEKERKKLEAEARRAAAKAKKKFKDELNSVKGDWEAGDARNIAEYTQGLKSWTDFLTEKHRLQEKFYDDQMAVFKKHNLEEDEDYQELLKKKEQLNADWLKRKAAMSVDEAKLAQKAEEVQAQIDFSTPGNALFQKEEALQLRLFDIRIKYLRKMREAYSRDSQEYHDYTIQITDAEGAEKLRLQKKYADLIFKYSEQYRLKSAKEQLEYQVALLTALQQAGVLSMKEYLEALRGLRGESLNDLLPESAKPQESEAAADERKMNEDLDRIKTKYDLKLLTEEEYLKAKEQIEKTYERRAIERAKRSGNEFSAAIIGIYSSFKDLGDMQGDELPGKIGKIGKAAESAFAVVNSCMQQYQEFSRASLDLEVARIERRYQVEADLAEGNVYKQKQAEKKKQKDIAKAKNDAAKKQFAMQVIQAVAQTATNALNAYGSAAAVPVVGHILAPIAAAMAIAAGMVQIATLRKQQQASEAQGYMTGGFTPDGPKDKPVGVVHAGEWVAPKSLVNNPTVRPVIDYLEYARRNNRIASITPADVSRSVTAQMSAAAASGNPVVVEVPQPAATASGDSGLSDVISRLNSRLNQPFVTVNTVAGDHGIRKAEEEYDRLMRNKSR